MVLGAYSQQHGQSLKRFATIIISFLLAVCSLTILSAKISLPTPRTVNKIGDGVELRVLPIGEYVTPNVQATLDMLTITKQFYHLGREKFGRQWVPQYTSQFTAQ